MNGVFADTSYWIALAVPEDPLHELAVVQSRAYGERGIVTTEMVLTEWLNALAAPIRGRRNAVILQCLSVRRRSDITIIAQSADLFGRALDLYASRPDKAWSLTDCASFLVMRDHRIETALTHDRHFEQAGFRALLR
jgi:uncharacterized protein